MGKLTTHVLDTMNGCPAAGMRVRLYSLAGDSATLLKELTLNHDGRAAYRLLFDVAPYFIARGVALPEPPFLNGVPLDFGLADTGAHYHVPLLASPWAYSTYRGS